jgi:hypothetical protein
LCEKFFARFQSEKTIISAASETDARVFGEGAAVRGGSMASIAALGCVRVAPALVGARGAPGNAGRRGRTASKRVSAEAGESGATATVEPPRDADAAVATRPSREACLPAASTAPPAAVAAFLKRKGRHAKFQGSMTGAVRLVESAESLRVGRGVRDYMSLPASQYNTLDGETVTRRGDDVFVCELGKLDFLGFTIKPVLTANVDVQPDGKGTVIRVEAATLKGSSLVEKADDLFEIDSVNRVGWRYLEDCDADSSTENTYDDAGKPEGRPCEIASETIVTVYLLVPSWFPFTVKATERTGNFVVKQVVKQVVPRFLKQLKNDYDVWATGDDCRDATCAGDLFDVDMQEK